MKNLYIYCSVILLLYIGLLHNSYLSYAQGNITYKLKSFDSLVQENIIEKPKMNAFFTCINKDTLYILQYFSLFEKIEMIPICVLNKYNINKSFYLGGEVEYIQDRTALMQSTLRNIFVNHCDTIYEIEQKLVESKLHHIKNDNKSRPNFVRRTLYYSLTKGLYNIIYEPVSKDYLNNLCWFYKERDFYNIYEINRDCD